MLGGSATAVAAQLAALGAEATLVSAVGDDPEGAQALSELTQRGVNVSLVQRSAGATAAVDVRVQPSGEPAYAASHRLNWAALAFDCALASALVGSDALTFSLFAQGDCLDLGALERAVAHPKTPWIGCDLNLRRAVPVEVLDRVAQNADLVKLNQREYELTRRVLGGEEPATWLLGRGRTTLVALTSGQHGARLVTRDTVIAQAGRTPPDLVDTVGAGDAFMAGLTVALLAELPAQEALLRAVTRAESQLTRQGAMPTPRQAQSEPG